MILTLGSFPKLKANPLYSFINEIKRTINMWAYSTIRIFRHLAKRLLVVVGSKPICIFALSTCLAVPALSASVEPTWLWQVGQGPESGNFYSNGDEACVAAVKFFGMSVGVAQEPNLGWGCWFISKYDPNPIFGQNLASPQYACPKGYLFNADEVICILGGNSLELAEPENDDSCSVGNPVAIASGKKTQQEVDFSLPAGGLPLSITRSYSSYTNYPSKNFGHRWSLTPYSQNIRGQFPETTIYVYRSPDHRWEFTLDSDNTYRSIDAPTAELSYKTSASGDYWVVTNGAHSREVYNAEGKLSEIHKGNFRNTLQYSDNLTPASVASSAGLLIKITDERGRYVDLFYDQENLLKRVDFAGITRLTYEYGDQKWDENRQLKSVTFADGSKKQYSYQSYSPLPDSAFYSGATVNTYFSLAGMPVVDTPPKVTPQQVAALGYAKFSLTGITDENGDLYASWAYDSRGRAVSSTHAGGADSVSLAFNASYKLTSTTNALGKETVYHYEEINNTRKLTRVSGVSTANCAAASKAITYDESGWVSSRTDWKGNLTRYERDAQGQEISRTEGVGTPEARTITTQWHATFRLPTKMTYPDMTVDFVYDANGNLLSRSESPNTL